MSQGTMVLGNQYPREPMSLGTNVSGNQCPREPMSLKGTKVLGNKFHRFLPGDINASSELLQACFVVMFNFFTYSVFLTF